MQGIRAPIYEFEGNTIQPIELSLLVLESVFPVPPRKSLSRELHWIDLGEDDIFVILSLPFHKHVSPSFICDSLMSSIKV